MRNDGVAWENLCGAEANGIHYEKCSFCNLVNDVIVCYVSFQESNKKNSFLIF